MPNWCNNELIISGEKKPLKSLMGRYFEKSRHILKKGTWVFLTLFVFVYYIQVQFGALGGLMFGKWMPGFGLGMFLLQFSIVIMVCFGICKAEPSSGPTFIFRKNNLKMRQLSGSKRAFYHQDISFT